MEIVNPGGLYGNARPDNFPMVNDYRNPVVAEALRVMGYVNKFNRGVARVQKELLDNGNGVAQFKIDLVTVFAVGVTNANCFNVSANVSGDVWKYYDFEGLVLADKSLKIIELCSASPMNKKQMMAAVGVTNQSNNVRAIVDPLLTEELIWPCPEDAAKVRGVRYVLTAKGRAFLSFLRSREVGNYASDSRGCYVSAGSATGLVRMQVRCGCTK